MSQQGRSARNRTRRLARRRAEAEHVDRSSRRSIWRSKWLLGTFGIVGAVALVASGVVIFFGDGAHTGIEPGAANPPPVRRTSDEIDIGEVEGKPTWDEQPAAELEDDVDYRARITLEDGDTIDIDLYETLAPVHVANFVFLANQKYYDDLTFHRIVPNFIAQTGDPTATSTGGAGYVLDDEPTTGANRGRLSLNASAVVAMARSGEGASSSQFFITLAPAPDLDPQGFTAFGEVTDGIGVAQGFRSRDPSAVPPPRAGPRIERITIIEEPRDGAAAERPPAPVSEPNGDKPSWDRPPPFTLEPDADYQATIVLADGGEIEIDLFEHEAPEHVNNFVFLSREGYYDGLTFHRIVEDFVAQGGDPTGSGRGGAGYLLPDEIVADDNRERLTLDAAGVISMARSARGASSTQFFITMMPQGFLDGMSFTAFGEVTEGLDIVLGFDLRDPADPSAPPGPEIETIVITQVPTEPAN